MGPLTFLLALMVLAGCTQSTAGTPREVEPSTLVITTPPQPTRPHVLKLDGKDPCALLKQPDLAKLHIDGPGRLGRSDVLKSGECTFTAQGASLTVTLVTTEGVDAWAPGKRLTFAVDERSIAGFPVKSLQRARSRGQCDLLVDVADDQYLLAGTYVPPAEAGRLPEKCVYARRLAEAVMASLLAG